MQIYTKLGESANFKGSFLLRLKKRLPLPPVMIKIGIDIGITSTKIAAVQGNEILFAVILREIFSPEIITDLLAHYGFKSTDVESISVTGVGQSKIKYPLLEKIPRPVGEFEANAAGAGFFYDLEKFIIVSMGTGTSFVKVENGEYEAKQFQNIDDIFDINIHQKKNYQSKLSQCNQMNFKSLRNLARSELYPNKAETRS